MSSSSSSSENDAFDPKNVELQQRILRKRSSSVATQIKKKPLKKAKNVHRKEKIEAEGDANAEKYNVKEKVRKRNIKHKKKTPGKLDDRSIEETVSESGSSSNDEDESRGSSSWRVFNVCDW